MKSITATVAATVVATAALFFASCAHVPRSSAAPGSELAGPAFKALPAGLADFLTALAAGAARRDAAFLLAAAEPNYERRVRASMDLPAYFALLYRLGAYSAESPAAGDTLPRHDPSTVRAIRYTGWTDRGPVIEVRAELWLADGRAVPSALFILWKTQPPRIMGREP